jgi:hypothetical protein
MPDFEDVAYEDSVSSDTYDEDPSDVLWEWEDDFTAPEDSRDYEMWPLEDCAAENYGEF